MGGDSGGDCLYFSSHEVAQDSSHFWNLCEIETSDLIVKNNQNSNSMTIHTFR
jgi:hypothetical protein